MCSPVQTSQEDLSKTIEGLPRYKAHGILLSKRVYTKSMVLGFYKCPLQFSLSHGLETGRLERIPPGFVVSLGLASDDLFNEWANRTKRGLPPISQEEAVQILSDKWDYRMSFVEDPTEKPEQGTKDLKMAMILRGYRDFLTNIAPHLGPPEATGDKWFGVEEECRVGGVRIAGSPDMVFKGAVVDFKTVGRSSKYRNPSPGDYELTHHSALTGKERSYFLPLVHEPVRGPVIKLTGGLVTPLHKEMAGIRVEKMDSCIQKGGPFLPAPTPGKFPCTPKYCGYFGRICPATKHLRREDFLDAKDKPS